MNLNVQQQRAVEMGQPVTVTVSGTECVLVRRDVYLRLDPDHDTGPWTAEEMNLLADEAEEMNSQRENTRNGEIVSGDVKARSPFFDVRPGTA